MKLYDLWKLDELRDLGDWPGAQRLDGARRPTVPLLGVRNHVARRARAALEHRFEDFPLGRRRRLQLLSGHGSPRLHL